jgi:hypothetical protein
MRQIHSGEMAGKTVLITGGSGGIGKATAWVWPLTVLHHRQRSVRRAIALRQPRIGASASL